jgi:hypothetical protein
MRYSEIIALVKKASAKSILYSLHALDEMNAEIEIITTSEIRHVINNGEIVEDYPEDKRGHSCLMFAMTDKGRPVHICCAPKEEYLAIITAYVPSLGKWEPDFKTRRKK